MGKTTLEKILGLHAGRDVVAGDVVDVKIDVRVARDFGGANVVKHLREKNLPLDDPSKTFFTFDCNPGGSDPLYAANQHICRLFARENGIRVFDINQGIGTHLLVDQGIVGPGETCISTDSHANILGAIGAFGQGMGDSDIAHAFAYGKVWFKVPPTVQVVLKGPRPASVSAKDMALALLQKWGASGLLGTGAEFCGPLADSLSLSERMTIASLCTEMGGIIALFRPNEEILRFCQKASGKTFEPLWADESAVYAKKIEVDFENLEPMIARPGHPDDVVKISSLPTIKIDSAFIGSCTNGRMEDLERTAEILKGKKVAPGVVLKIVPATDSIWKECLEKGLLKIFKSAGALVGHAGCAGCAAGQIGQNGPGEVTISSGNRNFVGKQGRGEVYLASPETVAASAVAGIIVSADGIPSTAHLFSMAPKKKKAPSPKKHQSNNRPTLLKGRVWLIPQHHIDTDMIYHNRHLAITELNEMGQYAFGNLKGWEDFEQKARPGDMIVTGENFGCGSSRQQAVDCFKSLRISLIIAESFGAIYERNGINAGFPLLTARLEGVESGHILEVNLATGKIKNLTTGAEGQGQPFSEIQMDLYQRGGLL